MNEVQRKIAIHCRQATEDNTMTFPEIVAQLMQVGFERYMVDFCNAKIIHYLPCGGNLTLDTPQEEILVPEHFDSVAIQAAIKEAQMNLPTYNYKSFRKKVMAAGCVGYIVSFLGRRAVYFGRTGETHVEHFPKQ